MAVPWQTDTANCGAAYPGTTAKQPAGDLPTVWPAIVPNRVLTQQVYQKIMAARTSADRLAAFSKREPWVRAMPPEGPSPGTNGPRNAAFVHRWPQLGFVVERPGLHDPALPARFSVETETEL